MAGKIPQSFIDDLLDRTDIVDVVSSRVKLKKTGRNYQGLCPFHDEKTPSFSVNPDKQFYYCFGCGAAGNAVGFLMDYERHDFVQTIEQLAHSHGLEVPREQSQANIQQQQQKRSIYDLLEQSSEFYQQQLHSHANCQQAQQYIQSRGLNSDICQQYGIGFAPPGWDNLKNALAKDTNDLKHLIDAGMLIEKEENNRCYDRFRERLMFPIRDNRGRTIAFGGRVLNDDKPKYLNSPETPVFHKQQELYGLYEARQANRHLSRLLMVEGYMDVVSLAQFGINWAVATLGTSAGTAHMEKVFRHCDEVIFCFDGDKAGRKAAERALEAVTPLMQKERKAKFLLLPEGEDPDTIVRSKGTEHFLWLIDTAPSLSEFLFELAGSGLNLQQADDKALLVERIQTRITPLPDGIFKTLILNKLSEITGIKLDEIQSLAQALSVQHEQQNQQASYGSEFDGHYVQEHHPDEHSNYSHNEPHPKQREKLSSAQQHVKRTPQIAAATMLLLEPSILKKHQQNPLVQKALSLEESKLALLHTMINTLINEPELDTNKILGRVSAWEHEYEDISRLLGLDHHIENVEQQEIEFLEALQQIIKKQQKLDNQNHIANLNKEASISDLSDEQKAQFLAIFQRDTQKNDTH